MTKTNIKLQPGSDFQPFDVFDLNGNAVTLGKHDNHWQMIIIYRGRHCPLCTKFLNKLETYRQRLQDTQINIVAVSADSKEQLEEHLGNLSVDFPMFYGLTEAQMKSLGVYISLPRSKKETDHNFPEPAMFIINKMGQLHVVDIANNPFVRPDLETLVSGLEWIKNPDNNYPIRGTATPK